MHTTLKPKKSRAAALKKSSGPAESSTADRISEPLDSQGPNAEGYQILDRKRIGRSPFNRKIIDVPALKTLADDLRIRGMLQPIIVRPNPKYKLDADGNAFAVSTETEGTRVQGGLNRTQATELLYVLNEPDFEIIAGERRWLAAGNAELSEVPVIIKVASDREAIEDQAVENMQREELNPIHEGEKYQQLLDVYKRLENLTTEQALARIEEKLHVGKSTVYARMRLLKLPEAAKGAALAGRLPASHCELIAKLDDAKAQEEVTKRILAPEDHEIGGEDDEEDSEDGANLMSRLTVMAFREAKWLVEQKQRELEKRREFNAAAEKHRAAGLPVLEGEEAAKIFNQWGQLKSDRFVQTSDRPNGYHKSWETTLGKKAPEIYLVQDARNLGPIFLFRRSDAEAALKQKTGGKNPRSLGAKSSSVADRERDHRARSKIFAELLEPVAGAAEKNESPEMWRFMAAEIIHVAGADPVARVAKRRFPESKRADAYRLLQDFAKTATGKQLRGLAAEILFARHAPSTWANDWGKSFATDCQFFGVEAPPFEVQTSGKDEEAA
jgi:ParB/RepB/Spo0J family partition protein